MVHSEASGGAQIAEAACGFKSAWIGHRGGQDETIADLLKTAKNPSLAHWFCEAVSALLPIFSKGVFFMSETTASGMSTASTAQNTAQDSTALLYEGTLADA